MDARRSREAIAELAARQHGIVARRQLLGLGVAGRLIDSRIRSGSLLPVFPGTYVLGRRIDFQSSLWMAATLAAGPGSALAGRSAAAAMGFMKADVMVEVSRSAGRPRRIKGSPPFHSRFRVGVTTTSLLPEGQVRIGCVPVMSVSAILIQLAGRVTEEQLRKAFIEAGRLKLLSPTVLDECRSRGRSFKGHSRLVELLEMWVPQVERSKSFLEGDFLLLCSGHGIPSPEVNVYVCGYEVDCLWRAHNLIVEMDGRAFHDDAVSFRSDRERWNRLTLSGYQVLRFTFEQVIRQPDFVAAEVRAALAKG